LRDLRAIAVELPEILMRYPRTFALLRERDDGSERGALELYRAWRWSGRNFETFARAARSTVIDDVLAWEQALVRAAARGSALHVRESAVRARGPIACADVLALSHDVPEVARALRAGGARARGEGDVACDRAEGPGSPMKASRLRVRGVASLVATLDGTRTRGARAHRRRSIGSPRRDSSGHSIHGSQKVTT
jgi:hypothetical protein